MAPATIFLPELPALIFLPQLLANVGIQWARRAPRRRAVLVPVVASVSYLAFALVYWSIEFQRLETLRAFFLVTFGGAFFHFIVASLFLISWLVYDRRRELRAMAR